MDSIGELIVILFMVTVYLCLDPNVFADWVKDFVNGGDFFIASSIISVIEIVAGFGLAWYLFKRKDVVSLKWWK